MVCYSAIDDSLGATDDAYEEIHDLAIFELYIVGTIFNFIKIAILKEKYPAELIHLDSYTRYESGYDQENNQNYNQMLNI